MHTIPNLLSAPPTVSLPKHDPYLNLACCHDVMFLINKFNMPPGGGNVTNAESPSATVLELIDPQLKKPRRYRGSYDRSPFVNCFASPRSSIPTWSAFVIWIDLFSQYIPLNLRAEFRDFETAAIGGFRQAWFRIGRDYETFNDVAHAKDCFERGVAKGVGSCCYRMGMAHLLGQLSLPANPSLALPLLHQAAKLSSLETPQPAYVYALLLLNEFTPASVPPHYIGDK